MLRDNPIEWLLTCILVRAARTPENAGFQSIKDPRLRHEVRQWVAQHRYCEIFPPDGWVLDDRRYWRAVRSERLHHLT